MTSSSTLLFVTMVLVSLTCDVRAYHWLRRKPDINLNGTALQTCSKQPMTGAFRNGKCSTGWADTGVHVVCAEMTDEFLQYTSAAGNNLIKPNPRSRFPGLKAGDRWCLCAVRWMAAVVDGVVTKINVAATHEAAVDTGNIPIDVLMSHAMTADEVADYPKNQ